MSKIFKYSFFKFYKNFLFNFVSLIYIKFIYYIIWPIRKPKIINYEGKSLNLATRNYFLPSRNLYSYGAKYEYIEKQLINNFVKPGDICVDVGSNIGFYSYLFLQKTGPKGIVYAFENQKEIFKILKKNFFKNKNFFYFFETLGDRKKKKNINSFIKGKIDFLKIDIDGNDFFVLKDFEYKIKKFSPKILIELSEASIRESNVHYLETVDFLKNQGYFVYEVHKNLKIFSRNLKHKEVINVLALKKKL